MWVGPLSLCRRGAAGAALLLALATGCVTLDTLACKWDKPPTGDVCQVVATWQNQVVYSPDPTRGGEPTPGLAGRLYLFGPEISWPLEGDGTAVVDLYHDAPGCPPAHLEQWRFPPEVLKRLLRKDTVGWGYTLFLPWGTYRPDITHVRLRVCYERPKGGPLYAEGAPITLNTGVEVQVSSKTVPASELPQNARPNAGPAAAQAPVGATPAAVTPVAAPPPRSPYVLPAVGGTAVPAAAGKQ